MTLTLTLTRSTLTRAVQQALQQLGKGRKGGKAGEGGKRGKGDMEGYHPEVECDGSGQAPIVGTRFHRTGHDFDLCLAEFAKLPEAEKAQFEAIEPPAYRRKAGHAHDQAQPQAANAQVDAEAGPSPSIAVDARSASAPWSRLIPLPPHSDIGVIELRQKDFVLGKGIFKSTAPIRADARIRRAAPTI